MGKGSTFHFTAEFGIEQPSLPEVLRERPVLVVDANPVARRLLAEALHRWGMRPKAVSAAEAALAELEGAAASEPYPVVLVDGDSLHHEGLALVERVRSDRRFQNLPVVVFTATGAERYRRAGATACLPKPDRQAGLLRVLSESLAGAPAAQVPPRRAPLKILLAEDNRVNQMVAERMLKKYGHQVVVVQNGLEAVAAFENQSFDVILMDVQMPLMDGFEATAAIRARERGGSHVPIIAMTARAMRGDREQCLEAGMDTYLSKPFRADEFHAAIDQVVAPALAAVP